MEKILIIENNDQNRKILNRLFTNAGFQEILFSATGVEGLEKTKSEKPDLVIVDTFLPDMDGFEVCGKVKALDEVHPKVIVTTGHIDAVDAVKARQMGADDYVVKTKDFSSLLRAAQKWIQLPK